MSAAEAVTATFGAVGNDSGAGNNGGGGNLASGVTAPPPTVTGVSPASGSVAGGTEVTVTGSGFSTLPGGTQFSFGAGNPASEVSCPSMTSCVASTPPGTGTVDVIATSGGQSSVSSPPGDQFSYRSPAPPTSPVPCASAGGSRTTADQAYVCRLYPDLLGRGADAQGLAGWTALLAGGVPRSSVPAGLQASPEGRAHLVGTFYGRYLGRPADGSGLSTYGQELAGGIRDETVQAQILGSPEYFALHGSSNDSWLTAVYHDLLGRPVEPSAASGWFAALARQSRVQVAYELLSSQEYRSDLVDFSYTRLLGRTGAASEVAGWVSFLNLGATDEQVIAGIASSPEYYAGSF
jgi:hypothetical protein